MNVLLLAGGNSSERDVSLNSGGAIARALKSLGHTVAMIDPSCGLPLIESDHGLVLRDVHGTSLDYRALPVAGPEFRQVLFAEHKEQFDLVFLALHGGDGENGTIQNLLDLAGMPYTGSGMTASAIAMDKAVTKRLMMSAGISTPAFRFLRVNREIPTPQTPRAIIEELGLPLVVKPNDSGSTVGLSKVDSAEKLPAAIDICMQESPNVLIEQFIVGREMTVAVLDREALPVVEIRPRSGLYDYEAKYTKGKTEYLAPAPIDADIASRLQQAAVTLYEIVGADGLARVDFMLDQYNNYFCLELNTLPGMTELSLSPMAAQANGITFEQLVTRIIDSAKRESNTK